MRGWGLWLLELVSLSLGKVVVISKSHRKTGRDRIPLLRRADQAVIGAILFISLVMMATYGVYHGAMRGRLIDIERAEPTQIEFQVNINTATWPELLQLPSIGEERARAIVASREKEGPYCDQEDLLRVNGIGPKTLAKIRPFLQPMPNHRAMAGP